MKRHGIHRVYRMYKKMAERKYECKVECKVTPRDHIKGMSYRDAQNVLTNSLYYMVLLVWV